MYVCMYVCMYVYVYINNICIHIYIYIYIYIYIHIHTHLWYIHFGSAPPDRASAAAGSGLALITARIVAIILVLIMITLPMHASTNIRKALLRARRGSCPPPLPDPSQRCRRPERLVSCCGWTERPPPWVSLKPYSSSGYLGTTTISTIKHINKY